MYHYTPCKLMVTSPLVLCRSCHPASSWMPLSIKFSQSSDFAQLSIALNLAMLADNTGASSSSSICHKFHIGCSQESASRFIPAVGYFAFFLPLCSLFCWGRRSVFLRKLIAAQREITLSYKTVASPLVDQINESSQDSSSCEPLVVMRKWQPPIENELHDRL